MIFRLLLAAAIIAVAIFGIRWLRSHSSAQLRHTLRRMALYTVIAFLIALAATGRLHWLVAVIASLVPFLQRLLPLLRYVPFAQQLYRRYQAHKATTAPPPPGQTSSVNSRFVNMTLYHEDGHIDGVIIEGPYRQRRLQDLELDQLLQCLHEWQQLDEESARLLTAYLDQTYGADWRQQDSSASGSDDSTERQAMGEDEALAILGLERPVDDAAIIAAHRRLMQKLHPDRGGSNYLAVKLNQAKDLLLGQTPRDD
jgi:hypothetical protein